MFFAGPKFQKQRVVTALLYKLHILGPRMQFHLFGFTAVLGL